VTKSQPINKVIKESQLIETNLIEENEEIEKVRTDETT
jgi:hypothetical protein